MKSKKRKINRDLITRILIVVITIFILALLFPKSEAIDKEIKVGDIWTSRDLIAQFSFPVLKYPDEYERDLREAEKSILPIFERIDTIKTHNFKLLNSFLDDLSLLIKKYSEQKITYDSVLNFLESKGVGKKLAEPIARLDDKSLHDIKSLLNNIFDLIYRTGFLDQNKVDIDKDSIVIRNGKIERVYPKSSFFDQNDIEKLLTGALQNFENDSETVVELIRLISRKFITPDIIFNKKETLIAMEEARYKISKNIGIVLENERIVAKHQKITEEIKRKIDSYRRIKYEKGEKINEALQFLGKLLHIAGVILILAIYIYLFRKKVYSNTSKILIFSIILILISFLAYLTTRVETDLPIQYLIIIPVASMLIAIIFDSRLGFYYTVISSMIVGGIGGNDYTIATANIIAGTLAVFSVRDIKNRSQIFRSLLFILSGYLLAIISFGLERYETLTEMSNEAIFALVNAVISPIFTYGLLIFFERFFDVTTDLTLLELADFNHPLLKDLKLKAPGTFHHSVNLSILAESAAHSIGANSILTKVGALYHDIGKIIEPNYFIENILDEKSEHEDLDPEQSAQIILNHVEEGIELARKYKLPEEVIKFIPMHHGTTQVQYFLSMAKKLGRKVDEDRFRYPGPKPDSKETAIVMLADAVESMSKNLDEITEEKLNDLVKDIIQRRFFEGQLNESSLTLKDLDLIKQSFVDTLIGFYHQRIEYPQV